MTYPKEFIDWTVLQITDLFDDFKTQKFQHALKRNKMLLKKLRITQIAE